MLASKQSDVLQLPDGNEINNDVRVDRGGNIRNKKSINSINSISSGDSGASSRNKKGESGLTERRKPR